MREAVEPIIYIGLAVLAIGSTLIVPILVFSAYRALIRGEDQ